MIGHYNSSQSQQKYVASECADIVTAQAAMNKLASQGYILVQMMYFEKTAYTKSGDNNNMNPFYLIVMAKAI